MEEKEQTRYRISIFWSILFICLAAVADAATLIPLVGSFLGWIFWAIMSLVLWKFGLGFVNWRRLVPIIISTVAEIFPVVQELPTIIAAMIAILLLARIEDRFNISVLPTKKKPGVTPPKLKRKPLNTEPGIRYPNQN